MAANHRHFVEWRIILQSADVNIQEQKNPPQLAAQEMGAEFTRSIRDCFT